MTLQEIKNKYDEKADEIIDIYNGLDDNDKLEILTDYLQENNHEYPVSMSYFNELLSEKEPLEIAGLITDDFCVYDAFFWFDGYGKIHSGDISAVLKTFDDIDENWLKNNCGVYTCFNDYLAELSDIEEEYDELAEKLGEPLFGYEGE